MRLRRLLIRLGLLLAFFGLVALAVSGALRVGLGEWALLVGIVATIVTVESVRYVVRQFLKGLRGD